MRLEGPVGAFYLFPDFSPLASGLASRGIASSAQLCECLLDETGVALLPGCAFGRDDHELTARLAYVDFDGAQALAAAEGLGAQQAIDPEFLERYCTRTLTAVDRLCKWIG